MTLSEIGLVLRDLRLEAGLTQEQIAEMLGISPNYVSSVERGVRAPSWKLLVRYANAIGTNVVTLLREAGFLEPDTVTTEQELAALFQQEPRFATLLGLARNLHAAGSSELDELLIFARYRLEKRGKET